MSYKTRKVNYCYLKSANRAGNAAKILEQLKSAGINLLAFSGFPVGGGISQVDLVAENLGGIKKLAKQNNWKLSKQKKGFLIQGTDETGAVLKPINRLANAKINIVATDAVAAGKGRYGMILWVNPKDYRRAARALNAK